MSNLSDDQELSKYLGGNTEYSRRYRSIESDEVPAELDSLVLAHAKSQLDTTTSPTTVTTLQTKQSKKLGYWMRVSVPVAFAASLILVVSIVIRSGVDNQAPRLPTLEPQAPSRAKAGNSAEQSVAAAVKKSKDVGDARDSAAKLSGEVASVAQEERKTIANQIAPVETSRTDPRNDPRNDRSADRKRMELQDSKTDALARRESVAAVPAAAPAQEKELQPAQEPIIADKAAGTTAPAPVTAAQVASATPATNARDKSQNAARDVDLQEIVVTAQLRTQRANSGAGPRGTIPPSSFAPKELTEEQYAKQLREADPVKWLAYIRELRTTNKTREADREWRRFVKAYPTYSVDEADTARPK